MKKTTTVLILLVVLMSLAIASDADNKNCAYCFINLCGLCWKVSSPLKHAAYDETAYATAAYDDGALSPTASPGH